MQYQSELFNPDNMKPLPCKSSVFQSNKGITIKQDSLDDIKTPTEDEHQFAILARQLLHGREVNSAWLQMTKNNNPTGNNDRQAKFRCDFTLSANGQVIGYIDPERKTYWKANGWPYPKINIARYPMQHWEENRITGRETNKLIAFRELPAMSFWVGVRTDWQVCVIVDAQTLFEQGRDAMQGTRYKSESLPVIELPNELGTLCQNADEFTEYIIRMYKERCCD